MMAGVVEVDRTGIDRDDRSAPNTLLQMLTGYWVSKALSVAAELGIADLLRNGPQTSEDLAVACGAHPPALYRLLRALASVGVFTEVEPGRFGRTRLAELLRGDTPGSMRALARMFGSEAYRAWDGLLESIRTGGPAFDRAFGVGYAEYLARNPEAGAIVNEALTGWTTQIADAVVAAYDFIGIDLIVEVGGGHGLLLATVLRAYRAVRGVLFDCPRVVAGARPVLIAAGVADRCETVGGDIFGGCLLVATPTS
jgi:hypothetical protein